MKKNKLIKCIVSFAILVSLMLVITACKEKKSGEKYDIYYVNASGNKITKMDYYTEESDTKKLIYELLGKMDEKQKSNEYNVIKPENLNVQNVNISEGVVTLDFSASYYEMKSSVEVLYRAAVVNEIVQIDSVQNVRFTVDNQEAVFSDGTIIGLMNKDSFADDYDEKIGSVDWRIINLYYANKTGDKLVKSEFSVAYSKNISLEKIVVERLIKGPVSNETYATLPADMRLLSISINNRTCYVNLSGEFLTEMVNVSTAIPVYSIVNSLCELDSVDEVKIMVNGNSTKTFRESINLDNSFSFNGELIQ